MSGAIMKGISVSKNYKTLIKRSVIFALSFIQIFSSVIFFNSGAALAATLTGGYVSLSDSRPGSVTTYTIDFDNVTASTTRCIRVRFSQSITSFTAVAGMTFGSVAFSGDYVPTPASWGVDVATPGQVALTLAGGETPGSATDRTITLTNITNGSTAENDFFVLLDTFSNVNCSTGPMDSGVAAFIYSNGQAVSLTVDPSISFTVTGVSSGGSVNGATTNVTTTATTIPFATTVTPSTNAIAEQVLAVSTNAGSGYTVFARYTAQLTSGANTINNHSGSNASPTTFSAAGTESFGYTTSDSTLSGTADRFTSTGGNKWAAFTASNAEVMYSATSAASDTADFGYQVGIAGNTEAGVYTTTVILTATPLY